MSRIYIASKQVTGAEIGDAVNREHLYLVYDPNESLSGDEQVIRGGPDVPMGWSGPFEADHGNLFIDAGRLLSLSDDAFSGDETPASRNFTELKLLPGQNADTVWVNLVNFTKTMGAHDVITQRVETTLDYSILGPNSNGTIGVILSGGAGIDIHENLPQQYGPGGVVIPASVFTGLEDYFTTGSGAKIITLSDGNTKNFYDADNGDTTIILDVPKILLDGGTSLNIFGDNSASRLDKLVLKGIDPASLKFGKVGNDLFIYFPGDYTPDIRILNQFVDNLKIPTLEVYPPGSGAVPIIIPLGNPDIFPSYPSPQGPQPISWLLPPSGLHDGGSQTFGQHGCPLVLDLDGDGVEVSKLGYGAAGSVVYFDIDADGFAERTAWVRGGDGLLVIDKNANGTIDTQSELFGNTAAYADGFAHLKSYDSNADNQITSADASWSQLQIWVDANANGISEAAELKTLASLQITQIDLAATVQTALFREENAVTATGTYVMNGVSRAIEDVWFQYDSADTQYRGNVTLDVRTLFLPTLKNVGERATW